MHTLPPHVDTVGIPLAQGRLGHDDKLPAISHTDVTPLLLLYCSCRARQAACKSKYSCGWKVLLTK